MVNDTLGHPGCFTIKFSEFVPWDNPGNVISSEVEDLVHELKDVVFLPILFLIGGPANVINMAVFYKQGLKERINVCLFALSLADGLYLVNSMLMYGEQFYFRFTTKVGLILLLSLSLSLCLCLCLCLCLSLSLSLSVCLFASTCIQKRKITQMLD